MGEKELCNHCWHPHTGPLMMVIKEGHVVQSCCKCQQLRQVHRAHALPDRLHAGKNWRSLFNERRRGISG